MICEHAETCKVMAGACVRNQSLHAETLDCKSGICQCVSSEYYGQQARCIWAVDETPPQHIRKRSKSVPVEQLECPHCKDFRSKDTAILIQHMLLHIQSLSETKDIADEERSVLRRRNAELFRMVCILRNAIINHMCSVAQLGPFRIRDDQHISLIQSIPTNLGDIDDQG